VDKVAFIQMWKLWKECKRCTKFTKWSTKYLWFWTKYV